LVQKLLTLSLLLLLIVSCDSAPSCNYQEGWDEYGGEYLTKQEAEELQASCLKTQNDLADSESHYDQY